MGSFWNQWGLAPSHLDTLLSSEECTLEMVFEEDDLLQELSSGNERLLTFVTSPDTMNGLLGYLMDEPKEGEDPIKRYKYPYLSCEILVAEVFSIVDTFYTHKELLERLFSYYERNPPLSPLHTTYTSRVATIMLQARVGDCISFLKEKKGFIGSLLRHLDNTAVIELLMKFIECETASEGVHSISQWFASENLIDVLLSKFDPSQKDVVHENTAQILSTIINSNSLYTGPILSQLESKSNVQKLYDTLLKAEQISLVVSLASTLVALFKRQTNEGGPQDPKLKFEELSNVLQVSVENLSKLEPLFHVQPKETKDYAELQPKGGKGTVVTSGPALGFRRLKLVELVSALSCTAFEVVDAAVIKSGTLERIIELFFEHQWNNVLHLEVEQMITCILEKNNEDLKIHLLRECKLLDRIVEASNLNESAISQVGGVRRGNMGHITSIAVEITNSAYIDSIIEKAVGKHEGWEKYKEGVLLDTVEKNRQVYGSSGSSDPFGVASTMEISLSVSDDMDDLEEEGDGDGEFEYNPESSEWQGAN